MVLKSPEAIDRNGGDVFEEGGKKTRSDRGAQ